MNEYIDYGYIGNNNMINRNITKPEWKRKIIRPAQSIVIFDDCLGSTALSSTESFLKLSIMNRHIAELQTPFQNRQALGCSVMLLVQSYTSKTGGVTRSVRENCTDLILWENKQKGAMDKIKMELGGALDEDEFDAAYAAAIKDKHDNLTVSFSPHCVTQTYRRNLSEYLIFNENECNCKK